MALSTTTDNYDLPLAALGRLSVRDALNRGFRLIDAALKANADGDADVDTSTILVATSISGGADAGDTLQSALADLTARIVVLETP